MEYNPHFAIPGADLTKPCTSCATFVCSASSCTKTLHSYVRNIAHLLRKLRHKMWSKNTYAVAHGFVNVKSAPGLLHGINVVHLPEHYALLYSTACTYMTAKMFSPQLPGLKSHPEMQPLNERHCSRPLFPSIHYFQEAEGRVRNDRCC